VKKFKELVNIFNALQQNGWEDLDINLSLLTKESQLLVNEWCQNYLDEIIEQITTKGSYQPPLEYSFYSCELKDWALKQAGKILEQWEDWYGECSCIDSYDNHCEVEEPFEYILQPEEYFQLDGLYAQRSSDYGALIIYIGENLLDLYDFLNEDESYEDLCKLYFGKSKLTKSERTYLLNFSF